VQVDVELSDRPIDLIADRLDFALRITATPPPQASARRIATIGWRLVASRRYLRAHGSPRRPADLVRHRVLLPSAYRARNEFTFTPGTAGEVESEAVRIDAALSITWTDSIARLVLQDAGIALLPDYLPAAADERARIAEVLPRWRLQHGPSDTLYALFLPGGRLRAAARALLDFLTPAAEASTGDAARGRRSRDPGAGSGR
jgi:hypothetical protein